jgi:RNA polymerase sigma factor (sigma-70 family)
VPVGRAWTALVRRYAGYISAVATRAFRLDPAAAEEVFQDTCVRIYDGLAGYAGRGTLRAWIREVTISACREYFRRAQRNLRETLEDPAELPEADAGQDLDSFERALDVREAVIALGDPCRGTLELAFFRDLTQAETARRLGVPEGTVAARVSRCLRRLRDRLQGDDDSGTSGRLR